MWEAENPAQSQGASGESGKRELALVWRRSFPRGDALQDLARAVRGNIEELPGLDHQPP